MPIARSLMGQNSTLPTLPLSLHVSGRCLQTAGGKPFLICGDAPWTPEVNLTRTQIDTYLADRQARGFNSIFFELIEALFTTTPPQNVAGDAPFTSAGDFSTPNEPYWQLIDYIVNQAAARGIACFMFPAYLGFNGGSEGWNAAITADTAGHLQTYGAFLAARYRGPWILGGDYAGTTPERDKQWNIVTGMRTVRTGDLITAHNSRTNSAYSSWSAYTGFNLNTIYAAKTGECDALAATEYARSGPMPFFLIEAGYEGEGSNTLANVRRSLYTSLLSGACGHFDVNALLWPFGTSTGTGDGLGAAHALATFLNTTGTQQRLYGFALLKMFSWWLGVPKIDGSVVASLGTSGTAARICPMVSSDGTWGLIWKNDTSSITVKMAAFSKTMRLRWFDPTNNTFNAIGNFANTVDQVITHPGNNSGGDTDWILAAD